MKIKNDFMTGTLISGALLIPATPFAVGTFMQDNYQYIQDVKVMWQPKFILGSLQILS